MIPKNIPLIFSGFTLLIILMAILLMRWLQEYTLLVSTGAAAFWSLGFVYVYGKSQPQQAQASDPTAHRQSLTILQLLPRGVALLFMLALLVLPMIFPKATIDTFFESAEGEGLVFRDQGILLITFACALFFLLGAWAERKR